MSLTAPCSQLFHKSTPDGVYTKGQPREASIYHPISGQPYVYFPTHDFQVILYSAFSGFYGHMDLLRLRSHEMLGPQRFPREFILQRFPEGCVRGYFGLNEWVKDTLLLRAILCLRKRQNNLQ